MPGADVTNLTGLDKRSSEFEEAYDDDREIRGAVFSQPLSKVPRRPVLLLQKSTSIADAIRALNEKRVGVALIVENGKLAGIFTERDVLRRVVGEARNPASTPVADVMSREVICCSPEMTLEEARGVMKNRRIRHLPVMEGDDHLLGLVSIGDLNAHQEHAQERHIHLLNEYLYGRV